VLSRNEWPHKYWKHATVKSHSEQFYIPCCSSLLPCTYQVHVTFHGGREAVRLFIAGCRCSCAILQVVGVYKHRSKVNLILQQAPPGNAILRGGGGFQIGDSGGKVGDSHHSNNRPANCPVRNVVNLPSLCVVAICHVLPIRKTRAPGGPGRQIYTVDRNICGGLRMENCLHVTGLW